MTEQTPTNLDNARVRLAESCAALYLLTREAQTDADRMKYRAMHSTTAATLASLFPPDVAREAKRKAMELRQVVGREPTDDEVSDVFQTMTLILVPPPLPKEQA